MKARVPGLFAIALVAGTVGFAVDAASTVTLGAGLSSEIPLVSIAEILESPDEWVGKRVKIAGRVSGVCAKMGCWMDITSAEDATLRVKVEDGVIVFPRDTVGRTAHAEGEVEILEMQRDKYEAWLRHVAEEEGREFDPQELGDPPYRIVRLRGFGAEISD